MIRPPCLIFHKSEWNRFQRQGVPSAKEPDNIKKKYLKALTEQSQEYMKTWPDSIASQLARIEKQKKKQQKDNIEFIKAYKQSVSEAKQENTAQAIKKAKQLIFENSNYGRKLLSALLKSKAIEERDAQIKFRKEEHQKAAELTKEEVTRKGGIDFYDKDAEREEERKLKTLECIRENKETVLLKKVKESQEKLMEKQCAIKERNLVKQVDEIEKKEKEEIKRFERQQLDEYKADTKKLAITKKHEEKLTDALIEAHKKEQDRIKLKTQAVLKKVHQARSDTKWSKDLYEKIKQIQSEEKKRYEDFVDKGVKAYELRNRKKETTDSLQEKQKSSDRYLTNQINKIAGQEAAKKYQNKYSCDRQSLVLKVTAKPFKKTKAKSNEYSPTTTNKSPENICGRQVEKLSFLEPRNKFIEELRKREKEPSPWNAAQSAHAQFAQQADGILKEINHKYFARKVVDEYRELNCLDATNLPVPNY